MDFQLTDEQGLFIETARRIGEDFGLEYWRDKDAREEYPAECWQAICDAGMAGAMVPEEFGGTGLGMVDLALVIEELCAGGAGSTLAQIFMLNPIFGGVSITNYGSDAMRAEWLPQLCSGQMSFCMALTEPEAGSNALEIGTTAKAQGDGWRLDGSKIWITGVPQSHKMLVVARTTALADSSRRSFGISLFMIDTERDGLTHTTIDKDRYQHLAGLVGVLRQRPGRARRAHRHAGRGLASAPRCAEHRTHRHHGGAWSGRVAWPSGSPSTTPRSGRSSATGPSPATRASSSRWPRPGPSWKQRRNLNLKAAWLFDNDQPFGSESNAAKLIASQVASRSAAQSMQTMGGMGYAKEMHVERLWRDAKLFRFAPVSEEMILNYIATRNLGMPRSY